MMKVMQRNRFYVKLHHFKMCYTVTAIQHTIHFAKSPNKVNEPCLQLVNTHDHVRLSIWQPFTACDSMFIYTTHKIVHDNCHQLMRCRQTSQQSCDGDVTMTVGGR